MSNDQLKGQDISQAEPENNNVSNAEQGTNPSRRKFAKTGIIAAPVIMSLSSRPVMGAWCTPSGLVSGNLSKEEPPSCGGMSPGGWKKDNGGQPPIDGLLRDVRFIDVFDTVWQGSEGYWPEATTLDNVLGNGANEVHTSNKDFYNFGFHSVAAYLNAYFRDVLGYAMTVDDVLEMVNAVLNTGYYEPAPGIIWGPQEVVAFIENTYH